MRHAPAAALALLLATVPAAAAAGVAAPSDCSDPFGVFSECPSATSMCALTPVPLPTVGTCWVLAPDAVEACAYASGCVATGWTGYVLAPDGALSVVGGACAIRCTVATLDASGAGAVLVLTGGCPMVGCTPSGAAGASADGASADATPMCVFLVPGASIGCWRVAGAADAGGASADQVGPCPNVTQTLVSVTGCYAAADAHASTSGEAGASATPACGRVIVAGTWRNVCVEQNV